MTKLRLIFHSWKTWNDSKSYYYKVQWPRSNPLLIARLDTFESGKQHEIGAVDSRLIISNIPQDSRIFFAIRTEKEHTGIEESLQLLGDPFHRIIPPAKKRRLRLPKKLVRAHTEKEHILVASTRSSRIIRELFEQYDLEWYTQSQFWFIIAHKDPRDWVEQLVNLSGPIGERLLRSTTIEDSYCIMTTLWDHGMDILSNKIPRLKLEEIVETIANERNIVLAVERGAQLD